MKQSHRNTAATYPVLTTLALAALYLAGVGGRLRGRRSGGSGRFGANADHRQIDHQRREV